jgi:hypothetical protein
MNMEVLSEQRQDMSASHLVSGRPLWKYLLFGDVTKLEVKSVYLKLQLTAKNVYRS